MVFATPAVMSAATKKVLASKPTFTKAKDTEGSYRATQKEETYSPCQSKGVVIGDPLMSAS